jgi:hypothetical protein
MQCKKKMERCAGCIVSSNLSRYKESEHTMSKLHIEDWNLPDGRPVPFRVNATETKPMPITEEAIKNAKAFDPYSCARAIIEGERVGLTTAEERMKWGQAIYRNHAIIAEEDDNSPVGRTRVLYGIKGKVATRLDNGEEVKEQLEELVPIPADKAPEAIRAAQRERAAKIKSGELKVDHRKKRSKAAKKSAAKRAPSRPRLQRVAPVELFAAAGIE